MKDAVLSAFSIFFTQSPSFLSFQRDIFTCKLDSHETHYEWVDDFERTGDVEHLTTKTWDGKQHLVSDYRIARQVPPRNNTNDALYVNFFENKVRCEETGENLHHSAFATPIEVTVETVEDYEIQARTRWKIENENNNTLKNQGYHFAHNFGHGGQFLSMVLLRQLAINNLPPSCLFFCPSSSL